MIKKKKYSFTSWACCSKARLDRRL